MKSILPLFFITFLSTLAYTQNNEAFKGLQGLQGKWKMETSRGPLYEEWNIFDNSLLLGRSYKLKGTDTVVLESVRLTNTQDGIYYIPMVKDQNNNQPVTFKMISNANTSYTFENKEHDYPQRVIYRIVNADSLVARIEGAKGDKQMSSDFYYTRVK